MKNPESKDECIKAICRFPQFYRNENLAPVEFMERSGYWKFRDQISIDDLEEEIEANPELVDLWLLFTDDKRWTPAWGISHFSDEYALFYMFRNGKTELQIEYKHGHEACARLIRFEMEGIKPKS